MEDLELIPTFLSTKPGRMMLFGYLTLMHFIVFCSTYYVAHKHDACYWNALAAKAAAAMPP